MQSHEFIQILSQVFKLLVVNVFNSISREIRIVEGIVILLRDMRCDPIVFAMNDLFSGGKAGAHT